MQDKHVTKIVSFSNYLIKITKHKQNKNRDTETVSVRESCQTIALIRIPTHSPKVSQCYSNAAERERERENSYNFKSL